MPTTLNYSNKLIYTCSFFPRLVRTTDLIEFDVVVAKTNLSMMDYMRVHNLHGKRNRSDDHDLDVVSNFKGNDFYTA
jgi:hypothetical protein